MRRKDSPQAILFAAVVFAGCDSLHAARSACETPEVTLPWGAAADVPYSGVTRDCASHLGGLLGFDWESFGGSPHDVEQPSDAADYAMGGAVVLLRFEGISTAEFMQGTSPRESIAIAMEEAPELGGASSEGDLWLRFVMSVVDRVSYGGAEDCVMSFSAYGQVNVCDLTAMQNDPLDRAALSAPGMASALIHEATHAFSRGEHHSSTGCPGFEYDLDINGAYGAQAHWLADWIDANGGKLAPEDLDLANEKLVSVCARIADASGLAACDGLSSACAD